VHQDKPGAGPGNKGQEVRVKPAGADIVDDVRALGNGCLGHLGLGRIHEIRTSFLSLITSMTAGCVFFPPGPGTGPAPGRLLLAADVDDVGPVGDQLEGVLDGPGGLEIQPAVVERIRSDVDERP